MTICDGELHEDLSTPSGYPTSLSDHVVAVVRENLKGDRALDEQVLQLVREGPRKLNHTRRPHEGWVSRESCVIRGFRATSSIPARSAPSASNLNPKLAQTGHGHHATSSRPNSSRSACSELRRASVCTPTDRPNPEHVFGSVFEPDDRNVSPPSAVASGELVRHRSRPKSDNFHRQIGDLPHRYIISGSDVVN